MANDEFIPTTQIGPVPHHKWNWTDPALQKRVRRGDVLMSDDCAYVVVQTVTKNGLVVSPDRAVGLWDWKRLKVGKWVITGERLGT